ncbi:O-antigen polymerase [Vibrio bivalvicida]|uniref:O-antigen polymerase n=1 Tax=Vibrio bivalvicida TaxID=1276888 RepID=A0ABV4MP37_9VIBR
MSGKLYDSKLKSCLFGTVIILFPWFIVSSIRVFGPVSHVDVSLDLIAYLMFFVSTTYLSFLVGFFIRNDSIKTNYGYSVYSSRGLIFQIRTMFFLLILVYVFIAYFDFFIVKHATLGGIVEQRESEHLTGPRNSVLGMFNVFLSGIPPLFMSILMFVPYRSRKMKLASMILVFLGFAAMFLSGGRNAFFISLLYCLFVKFAFFNKHSNVSKNRIRRMLILLVVFLGIVYSLNMFLERFEVQGFDVNTMLDYLEREYDISIYRMEFISLDYQPIYSVLVYLSFYVTHAFTYLDDYFQLSYSPYLLGGYNFYIVVRIIDFVTGSSLFQTGSESILQSGVYLTFPGTLYLDFGYFGGLIAGSVIGLFFGYLTNRLGNGTISHKLWFTFITVIMIFSPIYSVIGMANGWSLFVLITCTTFLSIRVRKRD